MNNDLNLSTRLLTKGSLLRIDDAVGTWVHCVSGSLWLTQEGDRRDIVLEPGAAARIERPGASILYALADARYMLLPQLPRTANRVEAAAHA